MPDLKQVNEIVSILKQAKQLPTFFIALDHFQAIFWHNYRANRFHIWTRIKQILTNSKHTKNHVENSKQMSHWARDILQVNIWRYDLSKSKSIYQF